MPDIERYTPSQMETEIQNLAEEYVSAVGELEEDNGYFSDISTAIQSKTGQVEPYDKSEMADVIEDELIYPNFEQKTVTPSTTQQTVTPSEGYEALESVTVEPVSDLIKNINFDGYMNNTIEHIYTTATQIPQYCFYQKSSIKTIEIPNVTFIGTSAFERCTSLTSILWSEGLTNIGNLAFRRCSNLKITSLPKNITNIGTETFRLCTSIEYLDMSDLLNIPTLGNDAFQGTTFPFYFKDQTQLDEFASATNWSVYADRFQIKGV